MPRIRVLYSWEGNGKPYLPNDVVDVSDQVARDRVSAGHAELVGDDVPVTRQSSPRSKRVGADVESAPPPSTPDGLASKVAALRSLRVPELARALDDVDDVEVLRAAVAAENDDPRPRNTAIQAIEARIAALGAGEHDASTASSDDTSSTAADDASDTDPDDASTAFVLRSGDEYVTSVDAEGHTLGSVEDAVTYESLDAATAVAERLGEGVLVVEIEVEPADDETDTDSEDED